MSETTMREAVLWEFTYDAGVHRLCRVADMADEILRLRDENTAFRAEIDRLRRILAALREPSEGMMQSALKEYGPGWFVAFHRTRLIDVIRAAVAAAEQEVGDANQ